uniref:Uncharacterized protein n=1 Tax=Timema genevievae TaxID=629358 RepID=A0A7R9JVP7_TIMGE|nr:unnamed protein product [Timema genevievae]
MLCQKECSMSSPCALMLCQTECSMSSSCAFMLCQKECSMSSSCVFMLCQTECSMSSSCAFMLCQKECRLLASRGVNVVLTASVPTANVPQEPRLELEPRTSLNSSADKLTDKYPTQPDPLTY